MQLQALGVVLLALSFHRMRAVKRGFRVQSRPFGEEPLAASIVTDVIGSSLEEDCPNGGVVFALGLMRMAMVSSIPMRSMEPKSFAMVPMARRDQRASKVRKALREKPVRMVQTVSLVQQSITVMVATPSTARMAPV